MSLKIERLTESLMLGEGPHWDVQSQSLYFVDIAGTSIHRYVPATKKHTKASLGTIRPSLIIPVEGKTNQFVLAQNRELSVVTWDGESEEVSNIEKLHEVEKDPNTPDTTFNDGKCDASGRLWVGTMVSNPLSENAPRIGTFYSVSGKDQPKPHFDSIGISNGLTWSVDNKRFYFIDSLKGTVDQFDFDLKEGTLSNRTVVFTVKKHGVVGIPDGMTIDANGHLWVAVFGSSSLLKIDPNNPETLLDTIKLPANQITSVAFGGPNLDQLFVTTGSLVIQGVELAKPVHGATYVITGTGSKGLPMVNFKL